MTEWTWVTWAFLAWAVVASALAFVLCVILGQIMEGYEQQISTLKRKLADRG